MARQTGHKETAALLRTVPLFAACSRKELVAIAQIAQRVDFAADQVICKEGETGAGFHVIVQGEVKVQVGGRTRRSLGPGAFFGELALLDGGPRTASVITVTPATTLAVPVWHFRSLLRTQPALALKLLEEICRRIRSLESSLTH